MPATEEDLTEAGRVYGAQGYLIAASPLPLVIGAIVPVTVRQRQLPQKMRVAGTATMAEAIEQQRMVDGPGFNVGPERCCGTLFYRLESD